MTEIQDWKWTVTATTSTRAPGFLKVERRALSVRLIGFGENLEKSLNCPQTPASSLGNFGQCVPLATEIDHDSVAIIAGPVQHQFAQRVVVVFQCDRRLAVDYVFREWHVSTPWRSSRVNHPANRFHESLRSGQKAMP
jgi:hypothetical protein